jgi:hypothetical protein
MTETVQDVAIRLLVPGMLNIVGEDHKESGSRRDEEKRFAAAKTLSDNYWTEASFPDLAQTFGTRKARGGRQQPKDDSAADLMELRAAHAAAMLIVRCEQLAGWATRVAAVPESEATRVITAFLAQKVKPFKDAEDRLDVTWRETNTVAVTAAVKQVFTEVKRVRQGYIAALRGVPGAQRLKATRALADNLVALRKLVEPLATAVGENPSDYTDTAGLAQAMRVRRSIFMGLAVGRSKAVGVWKIGDGHISDMLDGTVKVDMSKMNVVPRDDFNTEFDAWQLENST